MRSIRRRVSSILPLKIERAVSPLESISYTGDPQIERVVFICSLHRSGTTLLERLLSAHYELAYLRADVSESEGQHIQSVFSPAKAFGGPGRFAFSRRMMAELEGLTDHPDCRARILADWCRFVVGTSPVLLEKSPPKLTKIWWLREVFPGSSFVIMTRDPRAVAAATQKWSKISLPELMMHWNAAYSQAMADFREEDCMLVRYEELTARPDEEIARLGAFLGCAPRPNAGTLEERHSEMLNSNAEYLEAHEGARYGAGIWNRLGYDV